MTSEAQEQRLVLVASKVKQSCPGHTAVHLLRKSFGLCCQALDSAFLCSPFAVQLVHLDMLRMQPIYLQAAHQNDH